MAAPRDAVGLSARLAPVREELDAFVRTPSNVTSGSAHVRDGLDLKRVMATVLVALAPAMAWGIYNTGYQASAAIAAGATPREGWRSDVYASWVGSYDPADPLACALLGALYFVPVWLVTGAVGGAIEAAVAIVRKKSIHEGFLVTWFLFALILPATIPLWQVALGIAFGVFFGKELFGGTGMNIVNPALLGRAFLFFAYPANLSGDDAWTAATASDAWSGATWLAEAAASPQVLEERAFFDAFVGRVPGSMGETSALLCLVGAAILIIRGIASWRTMLGVALGTVAASLAFGAAGPAIPFWWHMVLGGWAFGAVFMATDPVTSCFTRPGKWIFGLSVGALAVVVRSANPAYPEGMMLAILLMNVLSPLIDHVVVRASVRRRRARLAR